MNEKPKAVVKLAHELKDRGYSVSKIVRTIRAELGVEVSPYTVRNWTDYYYRIAA